MSDKVKFYESERKPGENLSRCPVCDQVWESKLLAVWSICHQCYLSPAHFALMQKGRIPRGILLAGTQRIG